MFTLATKFELVSCLKIQMISLVIIYLIWQQSSLPLEEYNLDDFLDNALHEGDNGKSGKQYSGKTGSINYAECSWSLYICDLVVDLINGRWF